MNNILVSVLLPTRERPQLVHRSVQSLLSHSKVPSAIEIIVAYDEDDMASAEYFNSNKWHDLIKSFGASSKELLCPKWGYQGLHHYYTAMARQAQGQWFLIWNDDATILTPEWDQYVQQNANFIGMLHMGTENFKSALTLFPLIPRVWLELFGEISQHQLNDSWIQDICHAADAVCGIPVSVFHDRYDVTGNNLDATYQNRRYDKKIYNHEDTKKIRSEWAIQLKEYRERMGACEPMPRPTEVR
jgi:hypothetical protein